MSIANKIKALLMIKEKSNADLANCLGIPTQALNNKLHRGSFSAEDLVRITACLDCELAIIIDDKQMLMLDEVDIRNKK